LFILKQKQKDHLHKLPPLLLRTVRRVSEEGTCDASESVAVRT
jgi:hypothetical protein